MGNLVMIEIRDDIPGWMHIEQLEWLADQASSHHRIIEIGAWAGRSADVLSRATLGAVWVVDSWSPTDPGDQTTKGLFDIDAACACNIYMDKVGYRNNVTTMMMTSADAYAQLGHLTFDMVFIDADHRYQAVLEDILMWRSLLSPKGLLCGHDGEYTDVRRAVDELVPDAQFFATPQENMDDALIWYTTNG